MTATSLAGRIAPIVANLNPEQNQAVTTTDGVLLVNAGAGTGKTRVLTTRIANIIAQGLAAPEEILAVTFTNKAAAEMRERLAFLVGEDTARRLEMGSFHSVSMRMLRTYAHNCGLRNERFLVMDDDDQRHIVEVAMEEIGIEDPDAKVGPRGIKHSKDWRDLAKRAHRQIADWKEEGLGPEELEAAIAARKKKDPAQVLPIFQAYQRHLLARNACDFADLILHVVKLMRRDPGVAGYLSNRFRYILVDEFQDTNELQYEWLSFLAQAHGNLCVVGDLDQCIYAWRGAKPEIFLNFPGDWPGSKIVTLHRNYRSTQPILDAANLVVDRTPRAAPKVLRSGRSGQPVRYTRYANHIEEADAIAQAIRTKLAKGTDPREIAVLLRTSRAMLMIEQGLKRVAIPYIVVGGVRFFERAEIKDAVGYLRLALDPTDSLAFRRVCNRPLRSVGEAAASRVLDIMLRQGLDCVAACRKAAADTTVRQPLKTRAGLDAVADLIEQAHRDCQAGVMLPGALVEGILNRCGYLSWLRQAEEDTAQEREENLRELIADANQYEDPATFLQVAVTMSAVDGTDEGGSVRISTIHAAKGLEFETVYTPCLEEEILPIASAARCGEDNETAEMSEERRICHVAWTRAKTELIVSSAAKRYDQDRRPSRFIRNAELPMHEATSPGRFAPRSNRPAYGGGAVRVGGWSRF